MRTWGLSATLGNLPIAADSIYPQPSSTPPTVISAALKKNIFIETIIPKHIDRFPWSGHIGTSLASQVIQKIEDAQSTLLFTNTRSQTEIWFQELLSIRPKWSGKIAMHHGSLDRSERDFAENGLREGSLKCVVCTSSLDLGVDFSPVDQVIQVGSPKGVARLLQRAGRSGHRPGASSRIIGVPTNALELIEFAAARKASKTQKIESRQPLSKPLDVLVQHLVTCAIGEPFTPEEMRREIQIYLRLPKSQRYRMAMGTHLHHKRRRSLSRLPPISKSHHRRRRPLLCHRKTAHHPAPPFHRHYHLR